MTSLEKRGKDWVVKVSAGGYSGETKHPTKKEAETWKKVLDSKGKENE